MPRLLSAADICNRARPRERGAPVDKLSGWSGPASFNKNQIGNRTCMSPADHLLDGPLIEFFQLVPGGLSPRRSDKSVGGVIPARALRYCEAITSASAFGWYVFLPVPFKVVWDGHDMLWTHPGVDEWLSLTRDGVQYPGFSDQFDQWAPADLRGFSPPFLTPSIQPGQLQIWTGCIAKTAPSWNLLVRGVANLSHSQSYHMLEGIIETDHWFGPLFDNVRILKTDVPIEFRSDMPFLQVQPVRKETYSDKLLQNYTVKDIDALSTADWDSFRRTVVVPNTDRDSKPGRYAVSVRKGAHGTATHAASTEAGRQGVTAEAAGSERIHAAGQPAAKSPY